MSAVHVGTWPLGSDSWHAARAKGLGGSEIAAVLGLSPWESPFSLWHRKAGHVPPQAVNDEMDAGTRLEPVIVQRNTERHHDLIARATGTWAHEDRLWQIANPDGIYCAKGRLTDSLIEAKFVIYPDEWGQAGTDQIPPYYLAQCRWYLDVFGLDTCYVEVFIGSQGEFREYVIHADEADQAFMRDKAQAFLASIAAGEPPDLDGSDATYQAVRHLAPGIQDVDMEISADLATEYERALRDAAAAKEAKQLAAARVAQAIGTARRATFMKQTYAIRVPGQNGAPPFLRPGRGIPSKGEAA